MQTAPEYDAQRAEYREQEDSRLIEVSRHDPDAFAALYHRYAEAIFWYLVARTGSQNHAARTLIHLLRSHYRQGTAWDRLPPMLPLDRQQGWGKGSAIPFSTPAAPSPRAQRRLRPAGSRRLFYAGLLLAIVIISTSVVLAASGILNLGKPTSATSTNPYFPLSGFHRTGPVLRSHARVELLWIGTEAEYINWPVDANSTARSVQRTPSP